MSHITKTFTQEEKDTLSQVVIKVEKVKNGFEDYITTTEVKHWWRTRSVITNVRKEDFHRDSLRMLWVWEWDGLQHIIGTNYYDRIKDLTVMLQLSDTVIMDVEMAKAYYYLLEQLKEEGVDNDYY